MRPREEWQKVKTERISLSDLFVGYALVLATLPAAASFIGYTLYGRPGIEGFIKISQGENVRLTIISYVLGIVSVYALGWILDVLAPYFGSKRNLPVSMQVVVYSHTASWIAGIFLVFPQLSILALGAGIYSLYLLFTGMKDVMEVPKERAVSYFIAAIFCSVLISIVILLFSGFVLG